MKVLRSILVACLLSLFAIPAQAGNFAKAVSYAGAGVWFAGMTLGLIAKGQANQSYQMYIQTTDSDTAKILWDDYESQVSEANKWLAIGFGGLGLSVTSFILDKRLSNRHASLDTFYENGQQRLAMAVKF